MDSPTRDAEPPGALERHTDPGEQDGLWDGPAPGKPCPFLAVHELRPLRSPGPLFLPGVPVTVRVEGSERYASGSKVRPNTVYSFRLTHGEFSWAVKKKFRHFQELHRELQRRQFLAHFLPLTRLALQDPRSEAAARELPALPHGGEASRRPSSKQKYLEGYLNTLLEMSFYRDYHAMAEFLDVSRLSFIRDLGAKGLEGPVLKRSGGHRLPGLNCAGRHQVCYRWSKRWLVVKDSFLLYLKPESGAVSFVLLFDPGFRVQVGQKTTEAKYGVCVENTCRSLVLKCSSYRQAQWWGQEIGQLAESRGKEFLQTHRHGAFVPVRKETPACWFVNGAGYFAAVADALAQAREEIFITDWWLSPEVYLKRPAQSDEWRLDLILKHKAEQGVCVCVLLYKEVGLALGINSDYSKRALLLLHPNIRGLSFACCGPATGVVPPGLGRLLGGPARPASSPPFGLAGRSSTAGCPLARLEWPPAALRLPRMWRGSSRRCSGRPFLPSGPPSSASSRFSAALVSPPLLLPLPRADVAESSDWAIGPEPVAHVALRAPGGRRGG